MGSTILVTGGAGYIGSHTCVELLEAGYDLVVVDNLDNSSQEAIARVEKITGKTVDFRDVDLLDEAALAAVFEDREIEAVVHFAGLKAVGESVEIPLRYYHNNLTGTVNLLACMKGRGVRRFVFSSSATVYGDPATVPVTEDMPLQPTNPYGRTKLFIEEICRDVGRMPNGDDWTIVLLRYFNPVGAHPSGLLGEDPKGIPNNLMPFILQVAVGRLSKLNVFGDDYPTPDGTGIRDYIHVVDLAKGHLAALRAMDRIEGCIPVNLGTGRGYSVLEMVAAVEKATGREIPKDIVARRPGDVAVVYADPTYARELLDWTAELGIDDICADSWRWQSQNPDGFDS